MKLYTIFKANGETNVRKKASLKNLQSWVGGPIEIGARGEGKILWVNENGLLLDLPRNIFYPQFVGDVVLEEHIEGGVYEQAG